MYCVALLASSAMWLANCSTSGRPFFKGMTIPASFPFSPVSKFLVSPISVVQKGFPVIRHSINTRGQLSPSK